LQNHYNRQSIHFALVFTRHQHPVVVRRHDAADLQHALLAGVSHRNDSLNRKSFRQLDLAVIKPESSGLSLSDGTSGAID
jgi:hypothetical protein